MIRGRQPFDIAGYQYRADLYCPNHIVDRYRREREQQGYVIDACSWRNDDPERWLDEHAAMRGIDRQNESTFDSDDFPKVVFDDQVEENDCCAECGIEL